MECDTLSLDIKAEENVAYGQLQAPPKISTEENIAYGQTICTEENVAYGQTIANIPLEEDKYYSAVM